MVSWSAGVEGEGDAPPPAHATTKQAPAPAQWLRRPIRPQRNASYAGSGDAELLRHGQKRRRKNAAAIPAASASAALLPCNGGRDDRNNSSTALRVEANTSMSVALFEEAEDTGAVVGETPTDDVDMGTPTASNTKTATSAAWRDAAAGRFQGEDEWHRIRGTTAVLERRQTEQVDAHSPPSPAQDVELLAFREYNDADIDSLEILPSQDFGGDISEDENHTASSRHPAAGSATTDSCPWRDFRDGTQQYEEEASEVFDNVIYAPRLLHPQAPQTTTPPRRPLVEPSDMYESESELSDGFEVSLSFAAVVPEPPVSMPTPPPAPAQAEASRSSSANSSPPDSSSHQWHARLSVKRDCSFIDCTTTAKKQPPAESRVQELAEPDDEFGVKLQLADKDDELSSIGSTSTKPSTGTYASTTHSFKSESSVPPRKKKRRKVRQLPLDAFLQVTQSSTSYTSNTS